MSSDGVAQVAVIGPGRVGTALAMALPSDRYAVSAVAGRGEASLRRFSERLPSAVPSDPTSAARDADLVLVTVSDDALDATVRAIARDEGVAEGSHWVHCAGLRGLDALRPAVLAGARAAACHPAQTLPDPDRAGERLDGAAWAVTARPADQRWACDLVADLGGVAHLVDEGARALYHAGLVVGANGLSAVVSLARDLLLAAGVDDPEAFLGPLVVAAAQGAAESGAAALTGPVRRGDARTIAAHLEELSVAFPEATETYRALGRLALGYARRAGLDRQAAAEIEEVLG